MGRFPRIYFVFGLFLILMTVYVTETIHQEKRNSRYGQLRSGFSSSGRPIAKPTKLPRFLQRKYEAWAADPQNVTALFHSIPLEVHHIKDDLFQMSAPYRNSKLKLLKVQVWMEFPNITKPNKPKFYKYLVDVTPAIGSGPRAGHVDDCSDITIVTKARYPETILEIKLDITSLYKSCKDRDNYEYFRMKLRLYCYEEDCEDIDMLKNSPKAYLVFKEHDELEDLMQVIPEAAPLDHDSVMKMPQTRAFRYRRKGAQHCSLRPFTFRFYDSGWGEHIVIPHEYRSNMCRGRCAFPLADHMNASNYAVIRSIASSMYRNVPCPSCVAKDLAPLAMIVHDENQVTVKVQKNMIAKSCRCA